jgi:hypothetical protein
MDILPFNDDAASPVKLHRSVEERAIATYIVDANTLLETVRLSTGISEKLADYGFDDEELAIGMALQERPPKPTRCAMTFCPPIAPRVWLP